MYSAEENIRCSESWMLVELDTINASIRLICKEKYIIFLYLYCIIQITLDAVASWLV